MLSPYMQCPGVMPPACTCIHAFLSTFLVRVGPASLHLGCQCRRRHRKCTIATLASKRKNTKHTCHSVENKPLVSKGCANTIAPHLHLNSSALELFRK